MKRLVGIPLVVVAALTGTVGVARADEPLPPVCYEVPVPPSVEDDCEFLRLPPTPSTAVPLDFPILRGALAVAERYWASRGVALPPLAGVYELPTEERWAGYGGFSDLPGNRIWLKRWVLELDSVLRSIRVRQRADLCYTVLHERGHNAGLRHSDARVLPIMAIPDEVGPGWLRKEVAPRCWSWAKHPFR